MDIDEAKGMLHLEKVDHIGIAVNDLDKSIPYYTEILGLPLLKIEEVESEKVRVAFIDAGNIKIELLTPIDETSAIYGFLSKRGEGIHHIAFGVTGIEDRLAELKEKGVQLINELPKIGAGGAEVAFLHPKSSYGVLMELCDKSKTKG